MKNKKTIKAIKSLRKETGLSQLDFAKKTGTSQGYISNLENGKYSLKFSMFTKMCAACELDWEIILNGK